MITTKFYLDTRSSKPGCPSPVKLVFNLKGTRALLLTGISVLASQWDDVHQMVIGHPRRNQLNALLAERKVDVDRLLYSMASAGEFIGLKISEIKNRVAKALSPEPEPEPERVTFISRFDAFCNAKSDGTQRIYLATRAKLYSYLGKDTLDSLSFEQMDVSWLKAFDAWMDSNSLSRNARNIHLRNIRAVFNDALTDEVITCYPFRKFKLRPEATRKRALTRDQFRALMELKLEPWLERYRDCFKLIFALQGINIVDLCHLTKPINGRVEYRRAKTHRLYSIAMTPEAEKLIENYRGEKQLLNYLDYCRDYRSFYHHLAAALRTIGEQIGVKGLSTYWARHTWATFAASLDIPKETIAAGLGHGGNTVTDIYIDFDQRKVDAANRLILDLAKTLGF